MIRTALGRTFRNALATATARPVTEGPTGLEWPLADSKICSVEEAYAYCERVARSREENFPIASQFVPAPLRPYLCAVYAFARLADDFTDEPAYEGEREELLGRWGVELSAAAHKRARHPAFVALSDTLERCRLPLPPLEALLRGFAMDLRLTRYSTYRELCDYTALAAEPVGRTLLFLFGHRDPELHRFSDVLCTALAQVNLWQDVAVDAERGRIYLPMEDLRHFGVDPESILRRQLTDKVRNLMAFQVARTRSLFLRGRPLCEMLEGPLGLELKVIYLAGVAVLDKIVQSGFDVLTRRPGLSGAEKAQLMLRVAGWTDQVQPA